jgi:2-amino-4-hydroxy-6-hydroxymethyldihydropteridine diphosphokinase
MNKARVFLALGSNLGQRENYLAAAILALKNNPAINVVQESSVYVTAPMYNPDQPDFLNMVIEIATDLRPEQLLTFCKNTERCFGRELSAVRNSPRKIDLDIIYFDDKTITSPDLTIPHPRLHERKFVLAPLAEIAPDLTLCNGQTVMELFEQCPDSGRVDRIGTLAELTTTPVSLGAL